MNLQLGEKAFRSMTVTARHVESYAQITGDRNPLHFDEAFAGSTKFDELTCQGGITTGLVHAIVGMDMPGPGTVFMSQNWKFSAPVYINDTITAEVEVAYIHESKPVCQLLVKVTNDNGTVVLEGDAWCYTLGSDE